MSGVSCDSAVVAYRPQLLTDNGSSYISGDLAAWLEGGGIDHVRGAPNHPQTHGKIERWHQTLKKRLLRQGGNHPQATEGDQGEDDRDASLGSHRQTAA